MGAGRGSPDGVVVIDEVDLTDKRRRIADFNIGHPVTGSESTYSIGFQGWVVGRNAPAVTLTINDGRGKHINLPLTHPREEVGALMPDVPWAGRCGFVARIGALHLAREFQLQLTAQLEDGTLGLIGHVRGRRRALPALSAHFTPVALTTIGRSGSTWLTWLLAQHPEIVAYRTFDREPKGMAYFAELIRALSQPTSYYAAICGEPDGADWWAGRDLGRDTDWYDSDPRTDRWLGTEYVESLLAFFGAKLDELVACQAEAEGKPDAHLFVEKMAPTFSGQELWLELHPAMREIFLVRDPRDVACSIFAFQRKRRAEWFWRTETWSDEEVIREPLGNDVQLLLHCWRQRADTGLLLRYEDLIGDPHGALARVFDHLGVDASASTVASVIERGALQDEARRSWHITSADVPRSVGRWRNDLPPALVETCDEVFAPAIEAFGYA